MHFAVETIEAMIYTIRGHRVMLDSDLANLYGVETKRLNEQVKRNADRFPADFMRIFTKLRSFLPMEFSLKSDVDQFKKDRKRIGLKGTTKSLSLGFMVHIKRRNYCIIIHVRE